MFTQKYYDRAFLHMLCDLRMKLMKDNNIIIRKSNQETQAEGHSSFFFLSLFLKRDCDLRASDVVASERETENKVTRC